jgi:cell wall-associated NlpC family hydrolase
MTLPQRYPTPADLIATAESFLGIPYLWGGTSAHGIDCSGLTQRVYFLNGVGLDRDADQQALGGRPVDVARPGDLFFFGKERVTHTAIATGERTFIHAPQSGKSVQRGELTDMSPLRATRRYLP